MAWLANCSVICMRKLRQKIEGHCYAQPPRWIFALGLLAIVFLFLLNPKASAQSCSGTGTGGCQQVSCPNGGTTSVSGTVYAPDGTDALPNILVYIPTTALTAFTDGVSTTNPVVDDAATLVSGSPLVQATSAANGTFTVTNVPPGSSIPLVIQAGRWRREFVIPTVASCSNTTLTTVTQGGSSSLAGYGESTSVRFAQTQGEGDIPKMALVTGHADSLECSLRKVGIADSEFTDYTVNVSSGGSAPGRVNLFQGTGNSGVSAGTTTHTESTLVGSTSTDFSGSLLGSYNVLMLPCQGNGTNYSTEDGRTNAIAFTGAGGRIFATHHSAFYINQDAAIDGAANWTSDSTLGNANGTINTGFSSGNTMAEWLQDIGATTTQGLVAMTSLFNDQTGVNPPTQAWTTLTSNSSDVLQFSFYTPVGAATSAQYGRVMFNEYHVDSSNSGSSQIFPAECTGTMAKTSPMSAQEHMLEYSLFDLMNFAVPVASTNIAIVLTPSPSSFTGGDPADTINVGVTNDGTSTIAISPTVTLSVTLPAGLTASAMTDPSGNWSCNVNTLTCTLLNPLAASGSNSVTLTVAVAANVTAGNVSVGASVASAGFSASTSGNISLGLAPAPAGTVTGPVEISATPTNVGSTTAAAGTVTFALSAGTIVSSVLVVTEGFTGQDFTNAGTGTCTAQTYTAASTCTVVVSFAPLYPGPRLGAVELLGGDNNVFATAYISAVGFGPEAIFQPGTQSFIASGGGSGSFDDSVADINGNVYVIDYENNQVLKETYLSGSYTQSTAFSGLDGPKGIAIDGAGNIYIANTMGNEVLKETLISGSYTQSTIGSGLVNPDGVAVDGGGNVYIADSSNNRVLMETLTGGTYVQSTIATGLNDPWRVAVDASGNLYITDTGNNQVLMETLSNGAYTQSTVETGLNAPRGVAVDGNGTIYIADTGNNRVIEEQLVNGSYVQSALMSSLNAPRSVVLDEKGNLYVADFGDNKLYRLDRSDAPSLSFAGTSPNVVSSDSPQIVSFINFGNTSLTAVAPGITGATDFPQVTGEASDCTAAFSLGATASCSLRVEFDPQTVGAKSESLLLIDNNLNNSSITQTITLSGTATAVAINLSPTTIAIPAIGVVYSQVLSASGGTGPYTFTLLSGSLPPGLSLSSNGTLSGTATAAGSFTFSIQAQDSTGGGSGGPYTGSHSFSVIIAAPSIVVEPGALPNATVGASYSETVSASGGSGTYTYAVTGGALPAGLSLNSATGALTGTATTVGVATFVITATDTTTTGPGAPYAGSETYSLIVGTAPVNQVATSTALTASSNPAILQSSIVFTATVSATSGAPTGSVTFRDGNTLLGSGTLSGRVATFSTSSLAAGPHSITASYAGDSNFAASTSGALSESIIDFGVSMVSGGSGSGAASQTVPPGGNATYSIAITPTAGTTFPTITYLTVTGLPSGATATLATKGWTELTGTSWSLPAFSALSDVSLSFHVPVASSASLGAPTQPGKSLPGKSGPMLGALICLPFAMLLRGFGKRARATACMLLLALLLVAITGLMGCGSKNGFYSEQANSYDVKITVTTGALSHSTNVTLNVQ